jgi:hypothetical protein
MSESNGDPEMKLPKITHPMFDVVIPSTKKKTKIRPMLVKEEKILLMAKVSESPYDIYNAIKQVVNNCLVAGDIDVNRLTLFDLDLFLRIRAVSVSNIVQVTYTDAEDGKEYPFGVDLDKVEVRWPENIDTKIALGPDEGFTMRYPLADIYNTPEFTTPGTPEAELIETLTINCIDSYFQGEHVYKFADNKKEDIKEFIGELDISAYNKIREFVSNLPTIYHEVKYTNSMGKEKVIKMTTLSDFFTLL